MSSSSIACFDADVERLRVRRPADADDREERDREGDEETPCHQCSCLRSPSRLERLFGIGEQLTRPLDQGLELGQRHTVLDLRTQRRAEQRLELLVDVRRVLDHVAPRSARSSRGRPRRRAPRPRRRRRPRSVSRISSRRSFDVRDRVLVGDGLEQHGVHGLGELGPHVRGGLLDVVVVGERRRRLHAGQRLRERLEVLVDLVGFLGPRLADRLLDVLVLLLGERSRTRRRPGTRPRGRASRPARPPRTRAPRSSAGRR